MPRPRKMSTKLKSVFENCYNISNNTKRFLIDMLGKQLQEAQQMHLLAERNNEAMARELQTYKDKLQAIMDEMALADSSTVITYYSLNQFG